MSRRIICSDDENEEHQSAISSSSSKNAAEIIDISGNDLIDAMHGNSKTKPPTTKRKADLPDDDDDGDYSDNNDDVDDDDEDYDHNDKRTSSSRRSSTSTTAKKRRSSVGFTEDFITQTAPRSMRSRDSSRSGSSAKEARRQEQLRELSNRLGKGLDGALSSDDDSFIATDDDDDVFVTSKKRKSKSGSQDRYTFSAARDRNSSSANRTPSVQSFFKGAKGDNDPTPRSRKPRTPEPSSGEDDDVADFILNSEEEREEEEERLLALEKQRQREKRKRRKEKEARRLTREAEGSSNKKKQKESAAVSSSTKKRVIQEDEDEEEIVVRSGRKNKSRIYVDDDEDDEGDSAIPAAKKRRGAADREEDEEVEDEASEGESNDSGSGSDNSSDEDDDDDDNAAEDGPLMYWQVDAMREQDQDANPDAMPIRKSFSLQEALRLYIEMLANAHVDADFLSKMARSPNSSPNSSYIAAARQIENKICVYRESMVGSGAWNVTFVTELNKRPFYICSPSSFHGAHGEKCSACNRTSTAACKQIYLFGMQYNAQNVWSSSRWDRAMPTAAFFHSRFAAKPDETVELSSSGGESSDRSDDEGDSDDGRGGARSNSGAAQACLWWKRKWPGELTSGKESRWMLSGHCCNRTQLYHTLLHYKLRLFLKVREKLDRVGGSVGEAMRDNGFIGNEVTRYESLLKTTERLYGGRGMESSSFESDCWQDDLDAATSIPPSGRSSSARQFNEDGGQSGGMLQWLQKGQTQES